MEEDTVLLSSYCCRTCLCTENTETKKTESFQSIFIPNLQDAFQSLTNLKVSQNDGLPTKICQNCTDKLWQFNEFKLQCIKSDGILKNERRISSTSLLHACVNDKNDDKITAPADVENEVIDPLDNKMQNICDDDYDDDEDDAVEDDDLLLTSELNTTDDDEDLIDDSDYDDEENLTKSTIKLLNTVVSPSDNKNKETSTVVDVNKDEAAKCLARKYLIQNSLLLKGKQPVKKKKSNRVINFPYVCNECGAGFVYQERFEGHLREHEGKKAAVCEFCGNEYSVWSYLRIHMEREHKDDIRYKCHCGKTFAYESGLMAHKSSSHGRSSLICEICGKSYIEKYLLDKHSLTHKTETPFECDQCDKKFKTEYRLRDHKFRHKNIRNHKCDVCGKAFITGSELRVHLRSHRSVVALNFDCKLCGQRFRRKAQLTIHMRKHNNNNNNNPPNI